MSFMDRSLLGQWHVTSMDDHVCWTIARYWTSTDDHGWPLCVYHLWILWHGAPCNEHTASTDDHWMTIVTMPTMPSMFNHIIHGYSDMDACWVEHPWMTFRWPLKKCLSWIQVAMLIPLSLDGLWVTSVTMTLMYDYGCV